MVHFYLVQRALRSFHGVCKSNREDIERRWQDEQYIASRYQQQLEARKPCPVPSRLR